MHKSKKGADKYNYALLLNSTIDDIHAIVKNGSYLGFELFKNIILNINEFSEFFKDDVNTYFLSENEKKLIVKIIYALRDYKELLDLKNLYEQEYDKTQYKIVSAFEVNPNNPKNSYILLKVISNQKGVVLDSGTFDESNLGILLNRYTIPENLQNTFCNAIWNIVSVVNDWIRATGNYFIINQRLFHDE